MSNTVDNRVVQMKFDNADFERNVQTSMGTLSKLNKSLDMSESTRGFDKISAAASRMDLSGIGNGVEAVRMKFSALEVIAITALANITNSALNAGKNIAKALTIDPIKSGFSEYETQINAVQTILANTESKGSTLQDVNNALAELNTYADKTIYNFTEMTRNIGTFTAAGVDLKTSVSAIKGIANLAAVSGSNAQQASTAMYQLSQALASGTVKLMDWNSVVNAGMGGQVFQDALKETARVHGVAIDDMISSEGSFRETLQNGWLTSDILTETLSKFTGDLNAEQLKTMGYTDDQIKSILKMGQTANDAATKVKTFTQLFDTLKEAAQSGWTQSWQIIVGDFGEAKELLTEMSNTFGSILGKMADERNNLLMGGLASGWKQLLGQGVNDAAGYEEEIAKVAKAHGVDLNAMVNDEVSFQDALKQSMKDGKLNSDTLGEALQNLTNKTAGMTDAQLEELGYTREQINELEKFNDSVKHGSINLDEFAEKMGKPSGRENLIEALRNSLNGVLSIIKPISEAFRQIFPPMTAEQLYKITENIRDLTAEFKLGLKDTDNLRKTFQGLFAVVDIVGQAFKAVFKAVAPLFSKLLGGSGDVLALTGSFGEWLTQLDETIRKTDFFTATINKMVSGVKNFFTNTKEVVSGFVASIANGFDTLKEKLNINFDFKIPGAEAISNLLDRIKERFEGASKGADDFKESVSKSFESIGDNPKIQAFMDTMKAFGDFMKNVGQVIGTALGDLGKKITESLGNADFSTVFDVLNGGIFATLLLSLNKVFKNASKTVDSVTKIFDKVGNSVGFITDIKKAVLDTFGAFQSQLKAKVLLQIAEAIGILTVSLLVLSLIDSEKLTFALGAITGLFIDLMAAMKVFTMLSPKGLKSLAQLAGIMIVMSISILILAGAMTMLSNLGWEGLAQGIIGLGAVVIALLGMAMVLSNMKGTIVKGCGSMIIIAIALRLLVSSVKALADLSWDELSKGLLGVGILLSELALFMLATQESSMSMKSVLNIFALAIALRVLASTVKVFGDMDTDALVKGLIAVGVVLAEISLFALAMEDVNISMKTAASMIFLGIAMQVFAKAVGTLGSMPIKNLVAGLLGMATVLTSITIAMNLMPDDMLKNAAGLVVVGIALNLMANAMKNIGGMSTEGLVKSLIGLAGGLLIMGIAMAAMEGGLPGAVAMIVMAGAMAIFAPALVLLSTMSWQGLAVGLAGLAGAFIILGVAGLVLGPLVPVILAASAAFLLIGVAIAAAGVGIMAVGVGLILMAAGFAALATLGAAGALAVSQALQIIVTSVVMLIPTILAKIAEGLVAFAQVIMQSAPIITMAVIMVVMSIMTGLLTTIPMIVKGIFTLLISVLNTIVENGPTIIAAVLTIITQVIQGIANALPGIIQAISTIITQVIQGIADALPGFIQAGTDLMVAFIQGVADMSVALVEAAFQAMITFINGLADCIDRNTPLLVAAMNRLMDSIINAALYVLTNSISRMKERGSAMMEGVKSGISDKVEAVKDAIRDLVSNAVSAITDKISDFKTAGANIIDGLISGINDKFKDAVDKASDLGNQILQSAKDALGIKSPSKEFAAVGRWSVLGLVKGLENYASLASRAAASVANGSLDAMRDSYNGISNIIDGNFDINPVIRPTLDLSNITNGARQINSMFNNQKLGVNGEIGQNGGAGLTGANYNFVQNNYSPKALSRTEIYRQTSNQFATLKGAVNNA